MLIGVKKTSSIKSIILTFVCFLIIVAIIVTCVTVSEVSTNDHAVSSVSVSEDVPQGTGNQNGTIVPTTTPTTTPTPRPFECFMVAGGPVVSNPTPGSFETGVLPRIETLVTGTDVVYGTAIYDLQFVFVTLDILARTFEFQTAPNMPGFEIYKCNSGTSIVAIT